MRKLLLFPLFFFFFSSLIPVFNDLKHKSHMFTDVWPYFEGTLPLVRKQCIDSPFRTRLCTQTLLVQRARNLVWIKLSAIAAIICESETFHYALFLHHWVAAFRPQACQQKVHLLKWGIQVWLWSTCTCYLLEYFYLYWFVLLPHCVLGEQVLCRFIFNFYFMLLFYINHSYIVN